MKNYVSYSLCGTMVATSGLQRRYSDFFALRECLVKRWKGLYVPGIPPKALSKIYF
ncbi:MAG: hypothetical protein MJ252_20560 [archaeon]|nr:hypothetical protein [archaeon]